jgi:hypothetical protein
MINDTNKTSLSCKLSAARKVQGTNQSESKSLHYGMQADRQRLLTHALTTKTFSSTLKRRKESSTNPTPPIPNILSIRYDLT